MVAQRPTFAGVRWSPVNKPAAPLRKFSPCFRTNPVRTGAVKVTSPSPTSQRSMGGWHQRRRHRSAGHDAHGMPNSSGAMSSCAATATVR